MANTPSEEAELILAAARSSGDAISVDALQASLPSLPRRTLQRRLAKLVADGLLQLEGRGRGARYRLPTRALEGQPEQPAAALGGQQPLVPLSPEGAAINARVRAPVQARKPVSYERSFLDAYRPNESAYLPEAVRTHLRQVGAVNDGERPAGTYARQILGRLLIDLSWNSSRLEGNTYSLLETERLLLQGQVVEGKNALDAQMILNHKAAIEFLVESADEVGFNRHTILNLHGLLSDNLLGDPEASGRLRRIPVSIAGSVYLPSAVPQVIEESFQQILDTAAAIRDPFEQAFFAMVHLPYLQPFEDVNKRVSRLAANIPFVRENLCPLSFTDVPERAYVEGLLGVYELNRYKLLRDVFIWAYERSATRYTAVRRSIGEPDPFRLRYRGQIREAVAEIVRRRAAPPDASAFIEQRSAAAIPLEDRARFAEVVRTELQALHEGNIARYQLRPSEFAAWQASWRSQ